MAFVAPWSKVICPFCFERFHLSKSHIRETGPAAKILPDVKLGQFLSVPAPLMGKVSEPKGGLFSRFLIKHLDSNLKRICPYCHMKLPHKTALGEISSKVFAFIGGRSSGKSNFFGILINSLNKYVSNDMGFVMFDQETFSVEEMKPISSSKLYNKRYRESLFDRKKAISQTQSASINNDSKIPLIYRVQFKKRFKHYFTKDNIIDLVIFDAAGEDVETHENLEMLCRYVLNASGIVFLIDPLNYPDLRSKLPLEVQSKLPDIQSDPESIVSSIKHLFERKERYKAEKAINIPTAFVVSKSDMFKEPLDDSSIILKDKVHKGKFDLEDCKRVSEEVKDLIKKFDSPQMVQYADTLFKNHSFFAVSALGQLPDQNLNISTISSIRIADPILWLFWKNGLIKHL